jgi:hypothetical protein
LDIKKKQKNKTKRPLIAKEMKLEGKKCPPILEERENLKKNSKNEIY